MTSKRIARVVREHDKNLLKIGDVEVTWGEGWVLSLRDKINTALQKEIDEAYNMALEDVVKIISCLQKKEYHASLAKQKNDPQVSEMHEQAACMLSEATQQIRRLNRGEG